MTACPQMSNLPFPATDAPVTSKNAVETVDLISHMDQNRPNIDTHAARVRHRLPEDVEVQ